MLKSVDISAGDYRYAIANQRDNTTDDSTFYHKLWEWISTSIYPSGNRHDSSLDIFNELTEQLIEMG